MLYRVHLSWAGFKLTTLVLIGTDCIGSCKSNYHVITNTKPPSPNLNNDDYDLVYNNQICTKTKHITGLIRGVVFGGAALIDATNCTVLFVKSLFVTYDLGIYSTPDTPSFLNEMDLINYRDDRYWNPYWLRIF